MLKTRKKPELLHLHMDITVNCNLFCKYCFYSEYNSKEFIEKELSLDKHKSIIDEAINMGCQKIILSGGEVLTSYKFKPLIKYCNEKKLKTIFITNGTLLTDDTIKFLSFYRDTIDEIKISFDGRGNDFVRGKGTTKLILSAIEKLDRNNFPWTLNTIINKYNVDYLNEIYDFLENYNPKYWRLDIPFISGRMAENKDEIGIFDMEIIIKRCAEIIKRNIIDTHKSFDLWIYNIYSPGLENYDFAEKTKDIHPCSYNKRNLGIRGLGEVTPCARFLDLKLSSVKGKSIRDAKKDEKYKKFWEIKVGDFKECFDCRYYKICGSGCRANAYECFGDIMRKDPLNCLIFPEMEKYIIPLFSIETQNSFKELLI